MRIFLVHWKVDELEFFSVPLEKAGHEVDFQHVEGGAGWKDLRANPPDAILISMRRLPAHGRRVAFVHKVTGWMSAIPLAFFDAPSDDETRNRTEFPDAAHLSWGEVGSWLDSLSTKRRRRAGVRRPKAVAKSSAVTSPTKKTAPRATRPARKKRAPASS